jgi:hypothetical protein
MLYLVRIIQIALSTVGLGKFVTFVEQADSVLSVTNPVI